jgi:hypothetical protein
MAFGIRAESPGYDACLEAARHIILENRSGFSANAGTRIVHRRSPIREPRYYLTS